MSIQEHLNKIRNAIKGSEVRESIAKGIETVYDDASEKHDNANMEVKIARGTHPNLRSRLEEVDNKQQQTTAQLAQTEQDFHIKIANKADKSALDVERERINTFTSLDSGSTTGDAELIDGRIDVDGVTHQSIGGAIRSQIKETKDDTGADYTYTLKDGVFINAQGLEATSANYSATGFIRVTYGLRVLVDKSISDNSRMVFYDKDKQPIGADPSRYLELTPIVLPEDTRFVRISTYKNQKNDMVIKPNPLQNSVVAIQNNLDVSNATVKNVQEQAQALSNTNYQFGTLPIIEGRYITRAAEPHGQYAHDENSNATELIEVLPNSFIKITDVYLLANRTVAGYDAQRNGIQSFTTESTADTEIIINTGNCRYITATGLGNTPPKFEYLNPVTAKDVDEFKKRNGYNTLYNQATKKPVLTIIDDDTASYQSLIDYKNLCDSLGIKVTFATLTDILENNDARIKDLLLDYERQGFTVVTHGHTQGDFYKPGEERDIVEAEKDLVTGLQKMHQMGFTDYKAGWVVPFGYYDDELKKLAIKWGFESLVRYDYQHQIEEPTKGNPMQRYQLHRYAFRDENELPTIKMLMDRAEDTNGWLLVGTHSASPLNKTPEFIQAFTEMIDYAEQLGFEVRTLNEELRRRKPIYNNYEMY